jgi:hypothetical protein
MTTQERGRGGAIGFDSVADMNNKRRVLELAESLTGEKPHTINIISYSVDSWGRYTALIEHNGQGKAPRGHREMIHERTI